MLHSGKNIAASSRLERLDSLKEEESGSADSTTADIGDKHKENSSSQSHESDDSRSRRGSSSSNSLTTNSKTFGLGIARRPSHNILLNMMSSEETASGPSSPLGFSKPKKNFVSRNDRPISNDSIATRTSELFSSNSSDVNSGDSSLDNDNDISKMGHNDASTDIHVNEESDDTENSSLDALSSSGAVNPNNSFGDNFSQNTEVKYMLSRNSTITSPQSQKTRHFFNSNDKTKSQVSFSGTNSTISSPMKNIEDTNKGALNHKLRSQSQPSLPTTSALYGHSNSTSAILPSKTILTPSQRYRLRKAQNESALRKSIRNKEKFYDEQDKGPDSQDKDLESSLIWNVPTTSFSTNSFLMSTNSKGMSKSGSSTNISTDGNKPLYKQSVYSCSFLDTYNMPTSPIPGVNNTTDFQYMQETTKNISSVYLDSSHKISQSKLNDRTASADFLPMEFKTASDLGFEDLVLVSEDKLEVTSHSRPSWLPPKDPIEKKMHEEQINKSTSMASIEQLDRNKEKEDRLIRDETNRQKFVLLLDRGVTRNSSLTNLKKIIWQTPFSKEVRLLMYDEILQSDAKLIRNEYVEKFADVMNLSNKMDFPRSKEAEIEQQIETRIKSKIAGKKQCSPSLLLMLKLKSISQQGLLPGDELLFNHFLMDPSFNSMEQVWEMVNLIQMTCFNDLCKEKYDNRILNSRGVVASYLLRNDDFKEEFSSQILNSSTWWNVLERVDHDLFMWIIDIIVVSNSQCFKRSPIIKENLKLKSWEYYRSKHVIVNYKILLSFVLNVLLNYHFGFNDLKSLSSLNDPNFCIPVPLDHLLDMGAINSMFIRKWLHYYKKF